MITALSLLLLYVFMAWTETVLSVVTLIIPMFIPCVKFKYSQ